MVDATIGEGIAQQVIAMRAGFNVRPADTAERFGVNFLDRLGLFALVHCLQEIIPIYALTCFSAPELDIFLCGEAAPWTVEEVHLSRCHSLGSLYLMHYIRITICATPYL